jgi:hypothetical protein
MTWPYYPQSDPYQSGNLSDLLLLLVEVDKGLTEG